MTDEDETGVEGGERGPAIQGLWVEKDNDLIRSKSGKPGT